MAVHVPGCLTHRGNGSRRVARVRLRSQNISCEGIGHVSCLPTGQGGRLGGQLIRRRRETDRRCGRRRICNHRRGRRKGRRPGKEGFSESCGPRRLLLLKPNAET